MKASIGMRSIAVLYMLCAALFAFLFVTAMTQPVMDTAVSTWQVLLVLAVVIAGFIALSVGLWRSSNIARWIAFAVHALVVVNSLFALYQGNIPAGASAIIFNILIAYTLYRSKPVMS
jgi:uncharacterized membrane protein